MNCRVCNQPLELLMTYADMPARAQYLSDTPEEYKVTLDVCQCKGCGLVQLSNEPVWYWKAPHRVESQQMDARLAQLREYTDFVSHMELEHQPYPNDYLSQYSGTGFIEVPNFDMVLEKSLFAEIMLDHLLYFTADTLKFTLQYNGFEVMSIGTTWHGYILQATVKKRDPLVLSPFAEQEKYLKEKLDEWIGIYKHVAIYGASHQAFAYLALLKPRVAFIVDNAPEKIGKYSPVGGLKIYDPRVLEASDCDAVIIMGAGYSDIIAERLDFDGGVAIMREGGLEVVK